MRRTIRVRFPPQAVLFFSPVASTPAMDHLFSTNQYWGSLLMRFKWSRALQLSPAITCTHLHDTVLKKKKFSFAFTVLQLHTGLHLKYLHKLNNCFCCGATVQIRPEELTFEVPLTHTITHPIRLLCGSTQLAAQAANTVHNKRNRLISVRSAGFEPAIPAIKRPQKYTLGRTATGIGRVMLPSLKWKKLH